MQVDRIRGVSGISSTASIARRRSGATFDLNAPSSDDMNSEAVDPVTESSASEAYSEDEEDAEPESGSLIDVEA
jgi:hypothetical protein